MNIERLKKFPEGRRIPCILTEGITSWRAFQNWSPAFFKDQYRDLMVTLNYDLPKEGSPYLRGAEGHTKVMKMAEAIDFMSQTDRCYLAQLEIDRFNNLELDFDILSMIPKSEHDKRVYTNLWIGKNTQSGLHYDYNDNFLVQIHGQKKVFLVAPEETKYVYPLPENFTKTQVNPANPDYKKFPKLQKATIWTGEINPGEALFIPRGWFHHIQAPSESISLNTWYGNELSQRNFLLSFYRSGFRTWFQFMKDFLWHGALKRPERMRLFCSPSLGKLAYSNLEKKVLGR